MQGNDISNEFPRTIMVHIDCLLQETQVPPKIFAGMRKPKRVKELDLLQCNRLYRTALDIRPTLECFSTGLDDAELQRWEDELDKLGLNAFRWFMPHASVDAVVNSLPYRPSLMGVVDLTERALRYGSYFIPFDKLVRN